MARRIQKQLIKISNETDWNTNDLRKICLAAAKAVGVKTKKLVTIKSNRRRPEVSGRATYPSAGLSEGYPSWLWLPKDPIRPEEFAKEVARVAAHEFMHNLGVKHKDMTKAQLYCYQQATWADGLVLRKKGQREKPKETAAQRGARLRKERAEHAQDMLKKAATRLKRAKTIEQKWREKVRYYERTEAKAAGPGRSARRVDG
jgi:hypothetical protein